jgi:alkaline phosphatase D
MTSINTTYAFNSEAAPVSAHDENDDDDHDHRRMNNRDDCDRDGLFHDHDSNNTISINGHPQSSPHRTASRWWKSSSTSTTICIGIIMILLGINIALLLQPTKSNDHASNAASTTTLSSPPPQKVSSMLYNALIPQWKPLPSSDTIITHIAFGSCASQNMPQSFWDSIILSSNEASQHQHHLPDLFIYTGDNVYGDCSSEECTELRMAYYNLSLHPSIQGIASQIPIIATLDDHDYGMNNCHAHNPYKDTARDLFREFFNYTWDDLPWHEGVYQSYAFGKENQKVQIILLDTRYGRSPFQETNDNASPFRPKEMDDIDQHMLSEFQWKWLQQQITKEPDVVLRIIISSGIE